MSARAAQTGITSIGQSLAELRQVAGLPGPAKSQLTDTSKCCEATLRLMQQLLWDAEGVVETAASEHSYLPSPRGQPNPSSDTVIPNEQGIGVGHGGSDGLQALSATALTARSVMLSVNGFNAHLCRPISHTALMVVPDAFVSLLTGCNQTCW